MKAPLFILLAAFTVSGCATTSGYDGNWAYGDRVYASRDDCQAAKKRSRDRGAVAGAVGGAATGALLGGNVAESAVAAGVGAVAGAALGNARRC